MMVIESPANGESRLAARWIPGGGVKRKTKALILNGMNIVLSSALVLVVVSNNAWAALSSGGVSFTPVQSIAVILATSTAILILAQSLALLEEHRWCAPAMYLGGLGTLPLGVLSIMAGFLLRNEARLASHSDEPAAVCQHCGYNVTTVSLPRCPECGHAFGFDKTFEELGVGKDELRSASLE